jgi:hypothetical protein
MILFKYIAREREDFFKVAIEPSLLLSTNYDSLVHITDADHILIIIFTDLLVKSAFRIA